MELTLRAQPKVWSISI